MESYINRFRFRVNHVTYIYNNKAFTKPCIVLAECKTDIIVMYTFYEDYILYVKGSDKDLYASAHSSKYCYSVVNCLNYIFFENYDKYKVTRITQVKKKMIQEYLNSYCSHITNRGDYPVESTCIDERTAVGYFFARICGYREENPELPKMEYMKLKDLWRMDLDKGKILLKLQIRNEQDGLVQLLRDMPEEVASLIIAEAMIHDPLLVFALILMLLMGLREGEVCNVIKRHSKYGDGIYIDFDGLSCCSFRVNLENEYVLRSDGVSTGHIKRKNIRTADSSLCDTIYRFYVKHLELSEEYQVEEYGAMFFNKYTKNGVHMALTVAQLAYRFDVILYKHVLKQLRYSNNVACRRFYTLLFSKTIGLHILRHTFSTMLAKAGASDVEIMTLRGDSVITSAQTYLVNKGALVQEYRDGLQRFADTLMMRDYEY